MQNVIACLFAAAIFIAVSLMSFEAGAEIIRRTCDSIEWRVGLAVGVAGPVGVALGLLCGWAVWKRFEG